MSEQKNYSPWLEDISKQYITPEIDPVPRRVVTAANFHEGEYILLVGARHWSKAMHNQLETINESRDIPVRSREFKQGFIDQYDQFMTREEAKYVALKNGQPLIGEDWGNELYSENLH